MILGGIALSFRFLVAAADAFAGALALGVFFGAAALATAVLPFSAPGLGPGLAPGIALGLGLGLGLAAATGAGGLAANRVRRTLGPMTSPVLDTTSSQSANFTHSGSYDDHVVNRMRARVLPS